MSYKEEINKIIPEGLKKQIKEIAQRFNIAPPPTAPPAPQEPVSLQEAPLQDGTILKYDTPTLAVGSVVTIVSPEGEMPAPEGELTLQDGTVIKVVNQEGKSVVESVTPGAGAPPAPQQQAAEDLSAKILEIANLLKGFEAQVKELKSENEALKKNNKESVEKFSALEKNVGEFMQVFNAVLETPTAAPIEVPKNKKPRPIDGYIAIASNKQTQK